MKAVHLLVMAIGLIALGSGLAAVLDRSATGPELQVPRVTVATGNLAIDDEERHMRELADLRREIDRLRADLRASNDLNRASEASQDELYAVKQELAALREQLAVIAGANGNRAAAAGDSSGGFLPSTREEMELVLADQAYEEEQRRRRLETVFDAQSIDTIWSQDAAYAVTEALHSEQLGRSNVDRIECRSSLCRVEVSHADDAAVNQFETWFPMQVGDSLPQIRYFTEQQGDGRSYTVMYLARKGYALPSLQE